MKANFVNKLIEKFSASIKDTMLETLDTEKLEQVTLEDGTILEYESLEPGKDISVVNGEEKTPAPDGDYKMPDGKMVNVIEGKIVEVKEAEAEEAEEEMEEEVEESTKMSLDTTPILESINSLDLSKDAEYFMSISVKDGKIAWGAITATEVIASEIEMSKETQFNESLVIEKENLKKEFKAQLDEAIEKLSKKKEESKKEKVEENLNIKNSDVIRERLGRKKLTN